MKLRNYALYFCALSFCLLSAASGAQTDSDPWLILPNSVSGAINTNTKRADLIRAYGTSNVVDREVSDAEGNIDIATVLFPDDPERRIQVLWQDGENQSYPNSVTIVGESSRWHAVHNISLGMPYSELERINGRAFSISWGTDLGSVVDDWEGGRIGKELKDVFIWFEDLPPNATPEEGSRAGGRAQRSRRVNQIRWDFAAKRH